MKKKIKYIACLLLSGITCNIQAQYSSTDIRHATGHGPYPITINFQHTRAGDRSVLRPFIQEFDRLYKTKNHTPLTGFAANVELVIASQHFFRMFGGQGLNIEGMKVGLGYRYAYTNIRNDQNLRLHLQEEVIGLNIGYRFNLLYPLTVEFLGGPTLYNFCTVTEHHELDDGINSTINRIRIGRGAFERDNVQKKLLSGLDTKCRLNLFDPGGTEGGLGLVFEYGRMFNFHKKDLSALYSEFLGSDITVKKRKDYGYFSCGLIFPLALRMTSR